MKNYFCHLQDKLKAGHISEPSLLIDCQRLDHNLQQVFQHLQHTGRRREALRLVVKSLPSPALLQHLVAQGAAEKFMCFHRPFLQQLLQLFPRGDFLLGKPLPAQGFANFLRDFTPPPGFDLSRQVHWLIDSGERLQQYLAIARRHRQRISVVVEINVGMERGGLQRPEHLAPLLQRVSGEPLLRFSGFMGYDAHVAKAPFFSSHKQAMTRSNRSYQGFIAALKHQHPELWRDDLLFNGAGSPTFFLHGKDSPLTELSLGSALLKPADFELPALEHLQCAAWIAAPVLKVQDPYRLPFFPTLSRLLYRHKKGLFLYGGRWLARPAWPAMESSALYGLSSNQQLMLCDKSTKVKGDDFVFFQPTQSEAVLLQFGKLLAAQDKLLRPWPLLSDSP